jgi:hypothetical protein
MPGVCHRRLGLCKILGTHRAEEIHPFTAFFDTSEGRFPTSRRRSRAKIVSQSCEQRSYVFHAFSHELKHCRLFDVALSFFSFPLGLDDGR